MERDARTMLEETDRSAGRNFAPLSLPRSVFFRAKVAPSGPLPAPQLKKDELAKRLRHFQLFDALPLATLKEIAANAQVRVYRRGEFLWQRGEAAQQVVFIESGFVKAARRDRKGACKTYGLFGPGDSLGLFAFWAGARYPTDAVALNEGLTLLAVDSTALTRLAQRHAPLAGKLQGEVARFTEAFIDKIEVISAGTISQRLAVLMMQLVNRYGVDRQGEKARLPICLTLEQISEIIGARVETVARGLGRWKRSGWLITDAHGCHFNCLDKVRELLPD